jgi:hypothetical protein
MAKKRRKAQAPQPMTEAGWLACKDPYPMLDFLRGRASDRKLRLFACALGRRLWDRFGQEEVRRAVEWAERVADGQAGPDELDGVCKAACWSVRAGHAAWAAANSAYPAARHAAAAAATQAGMTGLRKAGVAAVLREVFHPFRPVAADPSWRTPDVVMLAEAAYQERLLPQGALDTARLALLADALEDAGCTDEEVLGHLRGPGPHVRGCWALDLCLGKV